jgi:hypothetical protein
MADENKFLVKQQGDRVAIHGLAVMLPSKADALNLSQWLSTIAVAMPDPPPPPPEPEKETPQ